MWIQKKFPFWDLQTQKPGLFGGKIVIFAKQKNEKNILGNKNLLQYKNEIIITC